MEWYYIVIALLMTTLLISFLNIRRYTRDAKENEKHTKKLREIIYRLTKEKREIEEKYTYLKSLVIKTLPKD